MRITFVLPEATLSGGVRVVAVYAQRLKHRGHEVVVVSTPPKPLSFRERLRRIKRGQRPLVGQGPSHLDATDVEHRVLERARPVVESDVPDGDVVIATWWETAPWVAALPERKGAKAYLIQHDERAMYPQAEREEQRRGVMETWGLPMHRIVVARWLAELLDEHLGPGSAHVVANGVDLEQFHAPPRSKRAQPTVGVMYSTVHFKGCDISLKAFERAKKRVRGLQLVAFGSEPQEPHLPLPADARFTQAPPQGRLRELYASCDAWLFGSRCEGFGLPLLEAMACRTPVIATPTGAAPELVAGGGGLLVDPEDPAAMSGAIERIAEMNDAEWCAMADAAWETAQQHDWARATELFEAALMEAAESGRGAQERSVVRQ